jgi:hypothetical protein
LWLAATVGTIAGAALWSSLTDASIRRTLRRATGALVLTIVLAHLARHGVRGDGVAMGVDIVLAALGLGLLVQRP